MKTDELLIKQLNNLYALLRIEAKAEFSKYIQYIDPKYEMQWFHKIIADKCQSLYLGDIKRLMVFVPPQHGKMLANDTPILTTKGWKTHGEIRPGDFVYNNKGKVVRVIAETHQYECEMADVVFSRGEVIRAALPHEWSVYTDREKHRKRSRTGVKIKTERKPEILETQNLLAGQRRNPAIPVTSALHFKTQAQPIPAYILGLWLGDGSSDTAALTTKDDELLTEWKQYGESFNYQCKADKKGYTYFLTDYIRPRENRIVNLLKSINVIGNKHIPDIYKFGSIQQRLELLQGLMDSDGTVSKGGDCEYCSINRKLADDVYELVCSLGFRPAFCIGDATLRGKFISKKYRILFTPRRDDPVFRLTRKKQKLFEKTKKDATTPLYWFIENVIPTGKQFGKCIEVEGGIYLAGRSLVATHNSQLTSRMFPTWVLANDPTRKIAIASYSADLSEGFNRDAQRIMADVPYQSLIGSRHKAFKPIENTQLYETGFGGFIKAVGLEGGLTGQPADIGIIDDPVKGYTEAYSKTTRDKVWEWYVNVFLTRLHNDSRQLLIMTRWHKDDLAGRILKNEADKWDILTIKAIREDLEDKNDPRKLGEALWEKRHSITKLSDLRSLSLRTFTALYQQNPVEEGGNIIKSDWFRHCNEADFIRMLSTADPTFFIDTAYTNKTENDPSAILAAVRLGTDLYLYRGVKVLQKFPDLCRFIPQWTRQFRYGRSSSIRIEPKANGLSVIDQLRELTKLNVVKTPTPTIDKETKAHISSPYIESGRVVIVDGAWNDEFITEVCSFPAVEHDEYIDLLYYAIEHFLISESNDVSKLISAFR